MTEVRLIRVARFSAVHRYWRREWSAERNRAVFGAQADPHGHDYRAEVEVSGPVDAETGWVADLSELDRLLDEVLGPLGDADLNEAIPEARSGEMLPSTEGLAIWLWRRLEERIPGHARLRRVRLWESGELGAEVSAGGLSDG